ncbi:MAG: hypothetical protein ACD_50C00233G0003 [uncultured bacterium]|nr:MAG: hypothetical protein ACD_50C00233G0003 [uncultured bacterium]
MVVYTTNVCPDAECQKEVEAKLKDKKDHFETMQANSLKRRAENKRNKKLERKTS